jgi:hypothetical protein
VFASVAALLAGHGADVGNCPIEPFIAGAIINGWKQPLPPVRPLRGRRPAPPACEVDPCKSTVRRTRWASPVSIRSSCGTSRRHEEYGFDVRYLLLEV